MIRGGRAAGIPCLKGTHYKSHFGGMLQARFYTCRGGSVIVGSAFDSDPMSCRFESHPRN